MKKYLYLLMLVAFVGFASCSKDDSTGSDTTSNSGPINKKESVLNGRWSWSEINRYSLYGNEVVKVTTKTFVFDNGSVKYIIINHDHSSFMIEGTCTITNEEAHFMKIVWKKFSTLDDNGNWIVTENTEEKEDTYNYTITSTTLTLANGVYAGEFTKEQ